LVIYRNIGRVLWVFLLALLFLTSCSKKKVDPIVIDNDDVGKVEKISEYKLDVVEPSGLCFGRDHNSLFTVSDNNNKVYEIDFEGNIIRALAYSGGDLEGVSYNDDDDILAIVEERKRQVVLLNYDSGEEINRYDIDVKVNEPNKGLEGISWNTNNKAYYLLNENNPALMMVWKKDVGIISKVDLNFAGDYSGIFVDAEHSNLWIVSDESQMLYKCDYNVNVLKKYELNFSKGEGVVVDVLSNRIYVVSDKLSKLFVFRIVK